MLFVLLMGNVVSCQSWRDAKEVIAEADSLLVEHKIVTRDTTALLFAINTLDGSLGHVFAREDLAKAYYFMGRNFYYLNDFSTAADYYILCDRMNPSDPMYKGRINSCMGYLCKQDSCFKEALEFYEHSTDAFKKSGNEWYYAHNLLNVAEQYVNLQKYDEADSILQLASTHNIDSAYYADIVDIKAMALYNQQLYDSALVYLLSIKDYPRNIEARCFSNKLIMRCYYDMNKVEFAIPYAEYIIQQSTNLNYRSSAYCVLLDLVELINDINQLAQYSNEREDNDRLLQQMAKGYAQAADKLINYQKNPYPYIGWIVLLVCIMIVGICLWIWNKQKMQKAERETDELQAQIVHMESNQQAIIQNNLQVIREKVFNNSIAFPFDSEIWKDDTKLFKRVNDLYHSLFMYLQKDFNLKDHELKLILLVLLDAPNNTIADLLRYSYKSVGTMKRYVANKLGTQARYLKEFLIKYIASKSIIS